MTENASNFPRVLVVAPTIEFGGVQTVLLRATYLEALIRHNLIPTIITTAFSHKLARAILDQSHGLMLTGGSDVDPKLYGQDRLSTTEQPDTARDALELMLVRAAYEANIPTLGICRGIQIMNVALGGTLKQHVDGHARSSTPSYASLLLPESQHPIQIITDTQLWRILCGENGSIITVNSMHHQAIDTCSPDLIMSARSTHPNPGIIEAVEAPSHEFFIGTQFHIETQPNMDPIFAAFAQAITGYANQTVAE